jgi:BlaI family penicillinase repressor
MECPGLQLPSAYATMRSTTMRSDVTNETRLGSLERLVMEYVWSNPGCTAEECRQATSSQRSLRESTIRTVLTRLEQKRLVTHQEDGRSYRYRATAPKGSFAARAVNRIIREFCGGSVEKLLVGMVDNSLVDRKTLEKVARTVDHRPPRK